MSLLKRIEGATIQGGPSTPEGAPSATPTPQVPDQDTDTTPSPVVSPQAELDIDPPPVITVERKSSWERITEADEAKRDRVGEVIVQTIADQIKDNARPGGGKVSREIRFLHEAYRRTRPERDEQGNEMQPSPAQMKVALEAIYSRRKGGKADLDALANDPGALKKAFDEFPQTAARELFMGNYLDLSAQLQQRKDRLTGITKEKDGDKRTTLHQSVVEAVHLSMAKSQMEREARTILKRIGARPRFLVSGIGEIFGKAPQPYGDILSPAAKPLSEQPRSQKPLDQRGQGIKDRLVAESQTKIDSLHTDMTATEDRLLKTEGERAAVSSAARTDLFKRQIAIEDTEAALHKLKIARTSSGIFRHDEPATFPPDLKEKHDMLSAAKDEQSELKVANGTTLGGLRSDVNETEKAIEDAKRIKASGTVDNAAQLASLDVELRGKQDRLRREEERIAEAEREKAAEVERLQHAFNERKKALDTKEDENALSENTTKVKELEEKLKEQKSGLAATEKSLHDAEKQKAEELTTIRTELAINKEALEVAEEEKRGHENLDHIGIARLDIDELKTNLARAKAELKAGRGSTDEVERLQTELKVAEDEKTGDDVAYARARLERAIEGGNAGAITAELRNLRRKEVDLFAVHRGKELDAKREQRLKKLQDAKDSLLSQWNVRSMLSVMSNKVLTGGTVIDNSREFLNYNVMDPIKMLSDRVPQSWLTYVTEGTLLYAGRIKDRRKRQLDRFGGVMDAKMRTFKDKSLVMVADENRSTSAAAAYEIRMAKLRNTAAPTVDTAAPSREEPLPLVELRTQAEPFVKKISETPADQTVHLSGDEVEVVRQLCAREIGIALQAFSGNVPQELLAVIHAYEEKSKNPHDTSPVVISAQIQKEWDKSQIGKWIQIRNRANVSTPLPTPTIDTAASTPQVDAPDAETIALAQSIEPILEVLTRHYDTGVNGAGRIGREVQLKATEAIQLQQLLQKVQQKLAENPDLQKINAFIERNKNDPAFDENAVFEENSNVTGPEERITTGVPKIMVTSEMRKLWQLQRNIISGLNVVADPSKAVGVLATNLARDVEDGLKVLKIPRSPAQSQPAVAPQAVATPPVPGSAALTSEPVTPSAEDSKTLSLDEQIAQMQTILDKLRDVPSGQKVHLSDEEITHLRDFFELGLNNLFENCPPEISEVLQEVRRVVVAEFEDVEEFEFKKVKDEGQRSLKDQISFEKVDSDGIISIPENLDHNENWNDFIYWFNMTLRLEHADDLTFDKWEAKEATQDINNIIARLKPTAPISPSTPEDSVKEPVSLEEGAAQMQPILEKLNISSGEVELTEDEIGQINTFIESVQSKYLEAHPELQPLFDLYNSVTAIKGVSVDFSESADMKHLSASPGFGSTIEVPLAIYESWYPIQQMKYVQSALNYTTYNRLVASLMTDAIGDTLTVVRQLQAPNSSSQAGPSPKTIPWDINNLTRVSSAELQAGDPSEPVHYLRSVPLAPESGTAETERFSPRMSVRTEAKMVKGADGRILGTKPLSENEDQVFENSSQGVFAIFDGMGGHAGGREAATLARDRFSEYMSTYLRTHAKPTSPEEVEKLMNEAVIEANKVIVEKRKENVFNINMNTTFIGGMLLREPDGQTQLVVANVGDSRLYVMRKNGTLESVTLDQNVGFTSITSEERRNTQTILSNVTDRSTLSPQLAYQFDSRHAVGNDLGGLPFPPEFYHVRLEEGDRVLACSDGVSDPLTDSQLEVILRASTDIEQAADAILAATRYVAGQTSTENIRTKNDDRSVMVIDPFAK